MSKDKMKILFDSVLYTYEGITGHAREEARHLLRAGHQVFVTDDNYKGYFSPDFLKMYNNFDRDEDFVTYCVQPPIRQHMLNKSLVAHQDKKKLVYFLAFEGDLPPQWVEIINKMPIKVMLVPSEYNKETFIKNGVKHRIDILPHGINTSLYKPENISLFDDDDFVYFWAGTLHNSRKGFKEVAEAWKTFTKKNKKDKHIHLILKMNMIYGCSEENKKYIEELQGLGNVVFIENGIPEENMAELFKGAHAYISTSLSEGFGMNILQAMACGTPTITTNWSGNSDFCTDNTIDIPADKNKKSINDIYGEQQYQAADVKKLVAIMQDVKDNYKEHKKMAMAVSKDIRKEYDWQFIGKKLEKILYDIHRGKII